MEVINLNMPEGAQVELDGIDSYEIRRRTEKCWTLAGLVTLEDRVLGIYRRLESEALRAALERQVELEQAANKAEQAQRRAEEERRNLEKVVLEMSPRAQRCAGLEHALLALREHYDAVGAFLRAQSCDVAVEWLAEHDDESWSAAANPAARRSNGSGRGATSRCRCRRWPAGTS